MVPKTRGSEVQLFIIQPLYKTQIVKIKENGISTKVEINKFVKENYLRVWMSKDEIGPYGEYVGSKGTVLKSRIKIFNKRTNTYSIVAHNLKELEQVLHPSPIGFKIKKDEI